MAANSFTDSFIPCSICHEFRTILPTFDKTLSMLFPHQTDNSSGHSSLEYRSSIFIARIPRCWKITRFLDRYTDLVKPEQSMYPIHGCLGIRNIDASEVRRKRQSADRRLSACASITVISELCHKLDYAPRNWMRCLNVAQCSRAWLSRCTG